MTEWSPYDAGRYDAVVIVSPMCFGDESKDQDRALWFAPGQTAVVCDGVTSSPFAAEAAEIAARFSLVLFQGDVRERLRSICDFLVIRRLEAQRSGAVPPSSIPEAMRTLLDEVVKVKMAQSFQTTLVAANFTRTEAEVLVGVVQCGDSVFLAFASNGNLLASSPSVRSASDQPGKSADEALRDAPLRHRIRFRPGDQLLAKVLSEAADHPDWMEQAGLDPAYGKNWLACSPLDRHAGERQPPAARNDDEQVLELGDDDVLLVPKYLVEIQADPKCPGYVMFPYSRVLKLIGAEPSAPAVPLFEGKGSATAVLPDHVYTGEWTHFCERFPLHAHFVLASDGFYGAFPDPESLWAWLRSNEAGLHNAREQQRSLKDLHSQLHAGSGDDDISFIWVYPREAMVAEPDADEVAPSGKGADHAG